MGVRVQPRGRTDAAAARKRTASAAAVLAPRSPAARGGRVRNFPIRAGCAGGRLRKRARGTADRRTRNRWRVRRGRRRAPPMRRDVGRRRWRRRRPASQRTGGLHRRRKFNFTVKFTAQNKQTTTRLIFSNPYSHNLGPTTPTVRALLFTDGWMDIAHWPRSDYQDPLVIVWCTSGSLVMCGVRVAVTERV